jgi:hypothetical protein
MLHRLCRISLPVAILSFGAASAFAQAPAEPGTLPFVGELIDAESTPISGVFGAVFKAYAQAAGGEPLWSERGYIAVENGMYHIALGVGTPIPTELSGRDLFIAVELSGNEVSRAPVTIELAPRPRSRADIIAGLDIVYADVAERAVVAEEAREAENCSRIGGLTLDEIDRYDELLDEIVSVREDVNRVSRPTTGRSTTLERIGGAGGLPYNRTCPPNHVVVGFRGGAGDLIDSVELICAPIE